MPRVGEGKSVSAALAEVAGGSVSLVRENPRTTANLHMLSVSLGAYQVVEQAAATTECGRKAGLALLHGVVEDAKASDLVAQASAASRQRRAEVALPAVP